MNEPWRKVYQQIIVVVIIIGYLKGSADLLRVEAKSTNITSNLPQHCKTNYSSFSFNKNQIFLHLVMALSELIFDWNVSPSILC